MKYLILAALLLPSIANAELDQTLTVHSKSFRRIQVSANNGQTIALSSTTNDNLSCQFSYAGRVLEDQKNTKICSVKVVENPLPANIDVLVFNNNDKTVYVNVFKD